MIKMLVTPLIALLAASQVPSNGSLLANIVGTPTGANGYEDYLRAADDFDLNLWGVFDQWRGYKLRSAQGATGDALGDVPELPPGVSPDLNDFEVRLVVNGRFGRAYEILAQGNMKRVFDPRPSYGSTALYPELIYFKKLAQVGTNKARVEFAEGKTAQAVEDLLNGLQFAKNIFPTTVITSLVSIGIQAMILAEFNEDLGVLSLYDAQLVDKTCSELLNAPLDFQQVFKHELTMATGSLNQIIDKPSLLLSDDQEQTYGSALTNLSATDRQQLVSFVDQALSERCQAAIDRMSGPESSWPRDGSSSDPALSPDDKSVSNLALLLTNGLMGNDVPTQWRTALCKGRTQLRVLRLHMKVIEFHWQHGVWPTKIEQFADVESRTDPYTGRPFHYDYKGGSYRLYGTGVPGLGAIELKYKNLRVSQTSDINP